MKPYVAVDLLGPPQGRYVHAMGHGDFLFVSGMAPLDARGQLVSDDITKQTWATLNNMQAVLGLAGLSFRHVVKDTIYLLDMGDRLATHPVRDHFYGDHVPASTLIGVSELAVPGMRIEIDAVAVM